MQGSAAASRGQKISARMASSVSAASVLVIQWPEPPYFGALSEPPSALLQALNLRAIVCALNGWMSGMGEQLSGIVAW